MIPVWAGHPGVRGVGVGGAQDVGYAGGSLRRVGGCPDGAGPGPPEPADAVEVRRDQYVVLERGGARVGVLHEQARVPLIQHVGDPAAVGQFGTQLLQVPGGASGVGARHEFAPVVM